MKPSAASLNARGLTVEIAGKAIVREMDLELRPGQLTLLLGSNGAGKSTLLRALGGIKPPAAGEISVGNIALATMAQKERARRIAYLPQMLRAPFAFTVREFLDISNDYNLTDREIVEAMELGSLLPRALTTLSGGERQRAAVARALGGQAGVLLLDEPTAHLDLRYTLRLMHFLKARAARGDAVLVATHDLGLLLPFANRVLLLAHGELVFDGSREELTPDALERGLGIERRLLPDGAFQGI